MSRAFPINCWYACISSALSFAQSPGIGWPPLESDTHLMQCLVVPRFKPSPRFKEFAAAEPHHLLNRSTNVIVFERFNQNLEVRA